MEAPVSRRLVEEAAPKAENLALLVRYHTAQRAVGVGKVNHPQVAVAEPRRAAHAHPAVLVPLHLGLLLDQHVLAVAGHLPDGRTDLHRSLGPLELGELQDLYLYKRLGEQSGASRSAEEEMLDQFVDGDITEAIESLPENFRLPVLYADVEGFSYKEIAEILDIPIGTVMSRLARGKDQLRGLLSDRMSNLDRRIVPLKKDDQRKEVQNG